MTTDQLVHRQNVRAFLNASGLDKLPDITAEGVANDFRASFPADEDMPAHFKKVTDLVRTAHVDASVELFNIVVDAYASKFTSDEINEMITFFNTSAGKKIVEQKGIMLPELLSVCFSWSASVMKSIETELATLLNDASTAALETESVPEPQPQP